MYLGAGAAPATSIPASTVRLQTPVSVGGVLLTNFLGVMATWTDDFSKQSVPTQLFVWQPSFVPYPEIIADRFTDWDNGGTPGAKFVQGLLLDADTFGVAIALGIRNGDTAALEQTLSITHSGRQEKAYSVTAPFIAHLMRLEPQSTGGQQPTFPQWKLFGVKWVWQPTPEQVLNWVTQATTHGLRGFMHLRQASIAYAAAAPVTFTVTAFDGTSPAALTLPATGGAVQKVTLPFSFNKGMTMKYAAVSAQPFQIYEKASEVLVGQWGREDSYMNIPLIGGDHGDQATI
jgi:hypothetical protein